MKQSQPGDTADQKKQDADRRSRSALLIWLLLMAATLTFALTAVFTTVPRDQLTLVDNTTQSLQDFFWTDAQFDRTVTTSAYWNHPFVAGNLSGEVVSVVGGTFQVHFAVHPIVDEITVECISPGGTGCFGANDCCQTPQTQWCCTLPSCRSGGSNTCMTCNVEGGLCGSSFPIRPCCQTGLTCTSNGTTYSCTAPTAAPTPAPTAAPTVAPTNAPTKSPTAAPTAAPTTAPTAAPTTKAPTKAPTAAPTTAPTTAPTKAPTKAPTNAPTEVPVGTPTEAPTPPTNAPTTAPTTAPTATPTTAPTTAPTEAPTTAPTSAPTASPTVAPTESPTAAPTEAPTPAPTSAPTVPPPCPGTVTIFTRILRQRGDDPTFEPVGDIAMPTQGVANEMYVMTAQLETEADDVYRFQWSADCASMMLTPTAVDLALMGVAGEGVLPISTYLVATPT